MNYKSRIVSDYQVMQGKFVVKILLLNVLLGFSSTKGYTQDRMDTRDTTVFLDENGFREVPPKYNGGVEGFKKVLNQTIKYPNIAAKYAPSGQVVVSFTVEMDGSMSVAAVDMRELLFRKRVPQEVQESFRRDIHEEIHRVFAVMSAWVPANQGGKPVRVKFNMPLNMTLL